MGYISVADSIMRAETEAVNGQSSTFHPYFDNWTKSDDILTNCTFVELNQSVTVPVALKIILGTFLILFIVLATLGNSIVCYIVHQKPAMRSAINLLLANMAFSNIILAITCMPFAFVTLITEVWILGSVFCKIEGFVHAMLVSEAVSMLLIISVDRYLIIVLKRDRLTPLRAKYLIVGTWCFSLCLSVPPTFGWSIYTSYNGWMTCVLMEHRTKSDTGYVMLYHTIVFFVPVTILCYSYFAILRAVHRKRSRIHNHPDELAAPAAKLGLAINTPPRVSVDMNFKMRAFKTIFILFILFVVCWTPYGLCLTIWNMKSAMESRYVGGIVVIWLGYLNSALNPIIYCWRIKKFRDACADIVPRSLQMFPACPSRARRRINPAAVYECSDQHPPQQAQLQQLQVTSYLPQVAVTAV